MCPLTARSIDLIYTRNFELLEQELGITLWNPKRLRNSIDFNVQ